MDAGVFGTRVIGGGLAVVEPGWVDGLWSVGRLLVPAGAGCNTLGCAEVMPSPSPLGSAPWGGMVLFGLGQSWAQSHESATPSVGGHADTELAVI